ncbi:MAG: inactive transglutaminase family protein [Xanthomonadales bacterium]|nr:inactive transglutaminase family protein [Xanthomonadales bacterium]
MVLALVLIALGLGLFAWKVSSFGFPVKPEETSEVWVVQAHVAVDPGAGSLKVSMQLPTRTPGYGLSDEHFISRGFGLAVDDKPWQRTATWAIRRAGSERSLYYRGVYFHDENRQEIAPRPQFPNPPLLREPFQTALLEIVDEVRQESADIASFTTSVLVRLNDPAPEDNLALFVEGPLKLDKAHIAQLLLSGARIPVLTIQGVRLTDDSNNAPIQTFIAAHDGEQWLYFDPETGDSGLPGDFLVWWTGDDPFVSVEGGRLVNSEISVKRQAVSSLSLATERAELHGSRIVEFSLMSLPINIQSVYEVLLLVPLGAFIIVLLRNVVGVRSFGTFMPVLIALAFRETELLAGFLLFVTIVGVGLTFRFYLEKLRLLLVPRLAAVLIIVVLLMAVVSVISHQLGVEAGLSVALFPMVIIAMVIERMSIVWEEHGPANAMLDGVGSLAIAIIAYLVMGIDLFAWWVVVFPELLLVVLGLTIALGRYTGYRLTELFRFREAVS